MEADRAGTEAEVLIIILIVCFCLTFPTTKKTFQLYLLFNFTHTQCLEVKAVSKSCFTLIYLT